MQADEIEPDPYVEVEKEVESKVAKQRERGFAALSDLLILRPFRLVTTIVGGVFFLPAALMASPSGAEGIQAAWEHFVAPSVESTFKKPLGEF